MKEKIFRKKSIDRLTNPDQLNDLLKITSKTTWCALLSTGILLTFIIIWSFIGSIPTRITGQGMLIKSGGVYDVVSTSSGQIISQYVKVNDIIVKNQTVIIVSQPDILERMKKNRLELKELKSEHERNIIFYKKDFKLQQEYLTKQKENLQYSIKIEIDKLKWLKQKLDGQKEILDKGLITNQAYLDTKYEIKSIEEKLNNIKNMLKEISIKEFQLKDDLERKENSGLQKIKELQRNLEALEKEYDAKTRIISPYTGKVLEVSVEEGRVVKPGDIILNLELVEEENNELEVVIFIPSNEGKKVRPGMKTQISPSIAKVEEYGYILGTVTQAAEFPATPQGMMRVLHNETLVESLLKNGAPIEIYSKLIIDNNTISGYKWSSAKGFPALIQSGTLCDVKITIEEQPPITLVIPVLKKFLFES